MKIAAICCTYKRPDSLSHAIECFLRQDYPADKRELIILDDAGQYGNIKGDGWQIVSIPQRFRTLGEKRNASAALVSDDVEAYCVWDDDDIYLPWHISACVKAIEGADYTIPSRVYIDSDRGYDCNENEMFFHGAWMFRRSIFNAVSGYPFIQSGQDQGLLKRFKEAQYKVADSLMHEKRVSYIYRWHTGHDNHLSVMGKDGYEKFGRMPYDHVDEIIPCWDRDWIDTFHELKKKFG